MAHRAEKGTTAPGFLLTGNEAAERSDHHLWSAAGGDVRSDGIRFR